MVRLSLTLNLLFSIKSGGGVDRSGGPKNPLPYRAIGALRTKKSVDTIRLLPSQFFLDDCVAKVFNMKVYNSSLY